MSGSETFESINKHLVLAIQDSLLSYIGKEFQFEHLNYARIGDPMHIHSYAMSQTEDGSFHLNLASRFSTDTAGVAKLLGLQADPNVELKSIIEQLEAKISSNTLFTL
jgi:hypothetical protein